MREAYRLQKALLLSELEIRKKNLIVFIIYSDKTLPEFEDIFKKMGIVMKQLQKIISS